MSATHAQVDPELEDLVIAPQGQGGFHACWYPVATSTEVPAGEVVAKEFLDYQVAVWRTDAGVAQVSTSYCAHLGADLTSLGVVLGDCLRCPYHHWQYATSGECVVIPAPHDEIPETARIFAYPTEERFGLIWAYNGEVPHYDVPHPVGVTEDEVYYEVVVDEVLPVSSWAPVSNSVDLQHLSFLHGFEGAQLEPEGELEVTDHYVGTTQVVETTKGTFETGMRTWGTNVFSGSRRDADGNLGMVLFAPQCNINNGRCQTYTVCLAAKGDGGPDDLAARDAAFEGMKKQSWIFRKDDVPVQEGIHFRPRNLLSGADRWLKLYLEYVRDFPRADPAARYQ